MIVVYCVLNGKIIVDVPIPFGMVDEYQTIIVFIVSRWTTRYLYDRCTNVDKVTIVWVQKLSGVESLNVWGRTVFDVVDEGFCDVVGAEGGFMSCRWRNLNIELIVYLLVDNLSEIQGSKFDWQPNEPIEIPFHNEVIVRFRKSTKCIQSWVSLKSR